MSVQDDQIAEQINAAVLARFGEVIHAPKSVPHAAELLRMLTRSSHRRWTEQAIEPELLKLLFACALSAPSKSDLQQADIIHVVDRDKIKAIADLIPGLHKKTELRSTIFQVSLIALGVASVAITQLIVEG